MLLIALPSKLWTLNMILQEEIQVNTGRSKSLIQLYFGNATQLEKQDEVDVLVVSAYPGDYMPTSRSLIGALKYDLSVDVEQLSNEKEEDLRQSFSCWWSKPLPAEVAFRRILCFEGSYREGKTPPEVVGDLFRSLVSLCNWNELSVVMPVLATGDQGFSKTLMLKLLVETTIYWMQIGLPLKLVKLVIPEKKNIRTSSSGSNIQMLKYFQLLKSRWIERYQISTYNVDVSYDLYLCFHKTDEDIASTFHKKLCEINSDTTIYMKQVDVNPKHCFQQEIYEITFLRKTEFIILEQCVENTLLEEYRQDEKYTVRCDHQILYFIQPYNGRDYLLPLYVQEMESMPTYMSLVQYVDCRESRTNMNAVVSVCASIMTWLDNNRSTVKQRKLVQRMETSEELDEHVKGTSENKNGYQEDVYDVFVSYSHQDMGQASIIVKNIQAMQPEWNVFVDSTGLKAGCMWQKKLYESIENAKIFVALISPNYISSKVCQEEFNLALALHRDLNFHTVMVQVAIEKMKQLPSWCKDLPCFDFTLSPKEWDVEMRALLKTTSIVIENNFQDMKNPLAIKPLTSSWRQLNYKRGQPYLQKLLTSLDLKSLSINEKVDELDEERQYEIDVFISHQSHEQHYAEFLKQELLKLSSKLTISTMESRKNDPLSVLDKFRLVVPLLSSLYVNDSSCMEEFNSALFKHRWSSQIACCPVIIDNLPLSPVYPNLCLCLFSCTDSFWIEKHFTNPILDPWIEPIPAACLRDLAKFLVTSMNSVNVSEGALKTIMNVNEIEKSVEELRQSNDRYCINPLLFLAEDVTNENDEFEKPKIMSGHLPGKESGSPRSLSGHGSHHNSASYCDVFM